MIQSQGPLTVTMRKHRCHVQCDHPCHGVLHTRRVDRLKHAMMGALTAFMQPVDACLTLRGYPEHHWLGTTQLVSSGVERRTAAQMASQ